MESIIIEKGEATPAIHFEPQQGLLEIKGVSIPEDTDEFYKLLMTSLEEYVKTLELPHLDINFKFVYINTGTSAIIAKIIKLIEQLDAEKHQIQIRWYYEDGDEDMKDLGDYFGGFTALPFETISCEEIL
ncbi:MAG: DUF1987 domain-containing protein [Cytophagales bacterium]|nr:MAG: DUF1987 domain-containing protein [Cytophagales bacterium]